MGINTILESRKIYLLAWGEDKADIIKDAVEGKVTDTLPASYLQLHNNATVCIDIAAAAHLTRIQRPWLVTNCEWNDKLIRSAIVWLCLLLKKPILKLTNKDYNENGLSELLALYGSAYNVNIKIFNDLQHTITDGQVVSQTQTIPIVRNVPNHSLNVLLFSRRIQMMM